MFKHSLIKMVDCRKTKVWFSYFISRTFKALNLLLAVQEFDVVFQFRAGRMNEAADCLSGFVKFAENRNQSVAK